MGQDVATARSSSLAFAMASIPYGAQQPSSAQATLAHVRRNQKLSCRAISLDQEFVLAVVVRISYAPPGSDYDSSAATRQGGRALTARRPRNRLI